ncbi:TetR/AcrR family transcriptional regulator [Patulibacter sp. SYSU D01012]|uniref:TetR/AcrR family transcriptional regulator n=1 Tax=Patulibacter sp. SYSU D01012 TaxID=2817381 RepID=UPI001B31135A|nr:TetR/AcrR family transcriptional regulator [Patulibacter sp. SYSU D01012]
MSTPPAQELIADALAPDRIGHDAVRERILAAAAEGFRSTGIRRTSVNDIARRAAVGRMTVYRRFPQREGLVAAALLREVRIELGAIGAAIVTITDVEDQLVEGFARAIVAARTHPLLARLRETEPEDLIRRLTLDGATVLGLCRQFVGVFLRAAIDAGRLRPMDVDAVAEILARVGISLCSIPETALPVDDPEALRRFVRQHLVPILVGDAR